MGPGLEAGGLLVQRQNYSWLCDEKKLKKKKRLKGK